jgi:20S proteasome alpha/beta subunit
MSKEDAMEIALKALQKIERHERECSLRWKEATSELRGIRKDTLRNSKRWERLAWLVVGTLVTAILAAWFKGSI